MKFFIFLIFVLIISGCSKSDEIIRTPKQEIETRGVEADSEVSSILISLDREIRMAYEFFLRGEYSRALRVYKKAIRGYAKYDYLHRNAIIYSNISTIFQYLNDLDNAMRYLKISNDLIENYMPDSLLKIKLKAVNLNKLSLINILKKDIENAIKNNDISFELNSKISNEIGISKNYRAYALINFLKNNNKEAIKYLEHAIKINTKFDDYYDYILNKISLSEIFIKEKNYLFALENLKEALNMAKRKELGLKINIILTKIAYIYEIQNKIEEALENYKRAFEVALNLEVDDRIRKEKENELSIKIKDLYTKLNKINELNTYRDIINFFYYLREE